MKTIFFTIVLLSAITAGAQQNKFFDQEDFNKKLSAALDEYYKQPVRVQSINDSTVYSLLPGTNQTYTLSNGDNVKYGNGQMPVIIPGPVALQLKMPNAGLQTGNALLIQGLMPNAAPGYDTNKNLARIPGKD